MRNAKINILVVTSCPGTTAAVEAVAMKVFSKQSIIYTNATDSASDVSGQPIGNVKTITGAMNRLQSAKTYYCNKNLALILLLVSHQD